MLTLSCVYGQVEKGEAFWYKVLCCLDELQRLPVGSDAWLVRLEQGCVDAEHVPFADCAIRMCVAMLNLHLLSWKTDGGAALPLVAKKHIDALGEIQQQDKSLEPAARELVASFWKGVAARFCDARHVQSIFTSTTSWNITHSTRAYLARETAVASCELDAVHLLGAPTRHGSLWMRNRQLFAAEIAKALAALEYAVETTDSDDAAFLAAQIVVSARELLLSPRAAVTATAGGAPFAAASGDAISGSDASAGVDAPPTASNPPRTELEIVLEDAQKALLHALSNTSAPSPLLEAARATLEEKVVSCRGHADMMPENAAAALNSFRAMSAKGGVKPYLWSLWLADLRTAEEYCSRVINPNMRSAPGMWMYRDRQLAALRRFGEVYAIRMKSSDLGAALESTPCLKAVVCGERPLLLWPHTVLCKQH